MNAPDTAIAAVGRAVRLEQLAERKPDFWAEYRRGVHGDREALYAVAWCALQAHDLGITMTPSTVNALRRAIARKEALDAALHDHLAPERRSA